jgi:hypothetical protein
LTHQRGLLVAGDTGDRDPGAQEGLGIGHAEIAARGANLG